MHHRRFLLLPACALMWLLLQGCSDAEPVKDTLPVVRVEQERNASTACRLAALLAQFEARIPQGPLETTLVLSPDGMRLAMPDAGGVRVFDLAGASTMLIERARAVTWSADSRKLYLLTPALTFASIAEGRVGAESWLDSLLDSSRQARARWDDPNLFAAQFELLAVTQSTSQVRVMDLASRASFDIDVAARWRDDRPLNSVSVGWDANGSQPAVFVAHQWFDQRAAPAAMTIYNRVQAYDRKGGLLLAAETAGSEVAFIPRLVDRRILILARRPEFRCLRALGGDGHDFPIGDCTGDIEGVLVDRAGNPLAYKSFLSIRTRFARHLVPPADGAEDVRLLGVGDRAVTVLHLGKTSAKVAQLNPADGTPLREASLGSVGCAQPLVPPMVLDPPRGKPIAVELPAKGVVHGFLFQPLMPATGLVVSLHGGPRGVATRELLSTLGNAMLERGFAVLTVNYRGGTGYGRRYLEAPYGRELSTMLEDASALAARASQLLALGPQAPRVLHGQSFGGFAVLRAAISGDELGRRAILEAAICDLTSTPEFVAYGAGRHSSLTRVSDPDLALHELRVATLSDGSQGKVNLCGARLPVGVHVAVLHSRDDPIAPFARMQQFIDAQPKAQVFAGLCDQCGHAPFGMFALDSAARTDAVQKIVEFLGARTQPRE